MVNTSQQRMMILILLHLVQADLTKSLRKELERLSLNSIKTKAQLLIDLISKRACSVTTLYVQTLK